MSESTELRLQALLSDDPAHVYSEDELDAIEEIDPAMALRLARVQHFSAQQAQSVASDAPIDPEAVAAAVEEARRILAQDGGDIELVDIRERVVRVRLKGACVGCPNSVLDLKNVVERLVWARAPGVTEVQNVF